MIPRYYTTAEKEGLRMQVQVIAMNHELRPKPIMMAIARLKAMRLGAEEIDTMRKFCEAYRIDYDKINPVREKKRKRR